MKLRRVKTDDYGTFWIRYSNGKYEACFDLLTAIIGGPSPSLTLRYGDHLEELFKNSKTIFAGYTKVGD